jgi:hypothetical protein
MCCPGLPTSLSATLPAAVASSAVRAACPCAQTLCLPPARDQVALGGGGGGGGGLPRARYEPGVHGPMLTGPAGATLLAQWEACASEEARTALVEVRQLVVLARGAGLGGCRSV